MLPRLDRAEARTLVAEVTGGKTLPQEVLEQVVVRTDGVPLFIEELTKTVLESGILRDAGGRYELTGPASSARYSLDLACITFGPPGPARSRQRGCTDRRSARTFVLLWNDERGRRDADVSARRCIGAAGTRRAGVQAGDATEFRIHVQARACSGRSLQHVASTAPPAAALHDSRCA
jgi:hypothetical protein